MIQTCVVTYVNDILIFQIQNITAGPICLESVELESSESYTVHSLNTLPNGESVFKSRNMLEPNNSCQFLYCIKVSEAIFGIHVH